MMLSLLKCTALKEGYGEFKLEDATRQGYEIGKRHSFEYALLAHPARLAFGGGVPARRRFNHPLIAWKPRPRTREDGNPPALPGKMSFLKVGGKSVVLSALKSIPGGMVVRLYEAEGRQVEDASIELAWPVQAVSEVNLVEKEEKCIPLDGPTHRLSFMIKPFEIQNLQAHLIKPVENQRVDVGMFCLAKHPNIRFSQPICKSAAALSVL